MAEDEQTTNGSKEHEPPKGAERAATWSAGGADPIEYVATAKWLVLRKKDKPAAEVFSVSYLAVDGGEDRPLTFVFNGGPGASSAYLHVGAVGPQRVYFPADGSIPPMPPRLVDNDESWLRFTDLVFVDPVGTGFSRVIESDDAGKEGEKGKGDAKPDPKEYFAQKRDLESLCEFMSRWLSENRRWGSRIFIAGESYGGYRVGRLTRMLQETAGVALSGAILISPALELTPLSSTDYDVVGWVDVLPTMALAAHHHGRGRALPADASEDEVRAAAEEFAATEYAALLARGADMPEADRERVLSRYADFAGLSVDFARRAEGRVRIRPFSRELLRDERKVLGLYDASVTTTDPFPDRDEFAGPDPTLAGYSPAYTTAINRLLRSEIGVDTDREYQLLSFDVFQSWKDDAETHLFNPPPGATDDFRYGMALNPHMQAFITHGRYDLVTPYHASDRLRNLMRLDPATGERITVRHFPGGHMFYAWESSRREFAEAIAQFVADAS